MVINKDNHKNLVDIRTVKIDSELSKDERVKSYLEQIKNQNNFLCGDIEIVANYNENGMTLEECMKIFDYDMI